jgi:hypothetical protein
VLCLESFEMGDLMRRPKLHSNHTCCPEDFRQIPDITGNHCMDAVIMKNTNPDMRDRLREHLVEDVAYKINNGYGRGAVS